MMHRPFLKTPFSEKNEQQFDTLSPKLSPISIRMDKGLNFISKVLFCKLSEEYLLEKNNFNLK